jgi:hypothetical protein
MDELAKQVAMDTEIEDLVPMVVALDAKVTPKGRRMSTNSDARLEKYRGPAKNARPQPKKVLTKALDFAGLTKDEQVNLMLTACDHDKTYQDFKDMAEQDDGKFTEKKLDCLADVFSDTVWKLLSSNGIKSLSPTMLKEKLNPHVGKVIREIALGTYCNSLSLMRHQENPSIPYNADDTLFGALIGELFEKRGVLVLDAFNFLGTTDEVSGIFSIIKDSSVCTVLYQQVEATFLRGTHSPYRCTLHVACLTIAARAAPSPSQPNVLLCVCLCIWHAACCVYIYIYIYQ